MVEDFAGVVVFQVHQDGRNDLRVFVLDQVGNRRGIHPLQAFDTGGLARLQDARDKVRCLVVTERLGQYRTDVVVGVDMNRSMFFGCLQEFVQDALDLGAGNRFQRSHGVTELLYLARAKMLEHLGGVILAQSDEQRGALFEAFFRAELPFTPIQSLIMLAMAFGSFSAISRAFWILTA